MPRIHLVRHAHAAAGFGEALDPPLDDEGRAQAEALAERLAAMDPLPILVSPSLRTRQTAAAIEARWGTLALVDPGVGEMPSPSEVPAERKQWLRTAMASTWTDLGPRYTSWRTMVTGLVVGLPHDCIVVTHFVLINAVVGQATGDERVWCTTVPNAGIVVVDADHHELTVISGAEPRSAEPDQVL